MPPSQAVAEIDQRLGDAARAHEGRRHHEQRQRHQGRRIELVDDELRGADQRLAGDENKAPPRRARAPGRSACPQASRPKNSSRNRKVTRQVQRGAPGFGGTIMPSVSRGRVWPTVMVARIEAEQVADQADRVARRTSARRRPAARRNRSTSGKRRSVELRSSSGSRSRRSRQPYQTRPAQNDEGRDAVERLHPALAPAAAACAAPGRAGHGRRCAPAGWRRS